MRLARAMNARSCQSSPTRQVRARRPGYTLLEVVLAAFITVLLMIALYTALHLQYWHAEAGRNIVDQTTLAQGLMKRVADDISHQIAPTMPASKPSASSSSTTTASAGGGTQAAVGTAAPATGGGSPAAASPPASGSNSASASSSSSTTNNAVVFNLGVQGTTTSLTLYVSRVPRERGGNTSSTDNSLAQSGQPVVSDLRRVSYWLADKGLARQELKQVTSTDATNLPPDIPNPNSYVIAERVKDLKFSYWDGSQWKDSWDGTTVGSDGSTPIGPPMAIRIEMKIAPAGKGGDDSKRWKVYRHTVNILTANRQTQQPNQPLTGASQTTNQTNQTNKPSGSNP